MHIIAISNKRSMLVLLHKSLYLVRDVQFLCKFIGVERCDFLHVVFGHIVIIFLIEEDTIIDELLKGLDYFIAGWQGFIVAFSIILFYHLFGLVVTLFFRNQKWHFSPFEAKHTLPKKHIFKDVFWCIGDSNTIVIHEHIGLFLKLSISKMNLPIIPYFHPIVFLFLMLFVYVIVKMLILLCQFYDVLTHKVNPWAIYYIMGVAIAGNAFVDVFSIFFKSLVLYVHESMIIVGIIL